MAVLVRGKQRIVTHKVRDKVQRLYTREHRDQRKLQKEGAERETKSTRNKFRFMDSKQQWLLLLLSG